MLRQTSRVVLLVIGLVASASSGLAQPSVSIAINLPAPPPLVIVPDTPVQYAPGVGANYFFYGGQYYVFTERGWHVGRTYKGPWLVVAPAYVPGPLLSVPVRYYHAPPGHWKRWRRDAPPEWNPEWGHEWKKTHEHHDKDWKRAGNEDDREQKHFEKEGRKGHRK